MISRIPRDRFDDPYSAGVSSGPDELAFFNSISDRFDHPEVLELGCGEGRSVGQMAEKYPTWRLTCFNLKGYKRTSRGPPIGGAVSFDSEHEIKRMLDHYHVKLPEGANVPKVVLGDASKIPWPFIDGMFHLILSQATLSKIPEVDVVVREAGRSLARGGIALLGFGGATCKKVFWERKPEDRTLFCGDTIMGGSKVRIYLLQLAPFDNLQDNAAKDVWLSTNAGKYGGGMMTVLLLNKATNENKFIFNCPSTPKSYMYDALKYCPKFTPAWDRGMKRLSRFFTSLES